MNVALCISGHPRTYRKCVESVFDHIVRHYDVETFLHAWDYEDNAQTRATDVLELSNAYSATKCVVENQDLALLRMKPRGELSEWAPHTAAGKPMFYGIYAANDEAFVYGEDEAVEWDVMIRSRYDLRLKKKLDLTHKMEPKTVYVPQSDHGFIDWFAYGDTASMGTYASTVRAMELSFSEGCGPTNEEILQHHLRQCGVRVKPATLSGDDMELVR